MEDRLVGSNVSSRLENWRRKSGSEVDGENDPSSNKARRDSGRCLVTDELWGSVESDSSVVANTLCLARIVSNSHEERSGPSSNSVLNNLDCQQLFSACNDSLICFQLPRRRFCKTLSDAPSLRPLIIFYQQVLEDGHMSLIGILYPLCAA